MPVASNANYSCRIVDAVDDPIRRQNELPNVVVRKFADNPTQARKRSKGLRFFD